MQTLTQAIIKKFANPYVMVVVTIVLLQTFFILLYLVGLRLFPQLLQTTVIMLPGAAFFLPSIITLFSLEPAQSEALFHGVNPALSAFRILILVFLPTTIFWSLLASAIVYIVQRRKKLKSAI